MARVIKCVFIAIEIYKLFYDTEVLPFTSFDEFSRNQTPVTIMKSS